MPGTSTKKDNLHADTVFYPSIEYPAGIADQKSVALWLTGLSGAGKSTISNRINDQLRLLGRRTILLDGDRLRQGLNRDLGFAEADRVENIRRVGEVARLMVDAGLIAICSLISPYRTERQRVRSLFGQGEFIEIFVDTPIEECCRRDPKGLYARALKGELLDFTGISSPYEAPAAPELRLDTIREDAASLADRVVEELRRRGVLRA